MTKAEALALIQSLPDDCSIVLAYWDHADYFPRVARDDWAWLADYIEDKMDWSTAHDQMICLVEGLVREGQLKLLNKEGET